MNPFLTGLRFAQRLHAPSTSPHQSALHEQELPRWRTARDLQTAMYCLNRRKQYINSSRLFAKRKALTKVLEDLGQLEPEEVYETLAHVGKNAGLREIFGNPKVSKRVKAAMSNLMLCMSNVVLSLIHI